jgi:TIR domain
VAGRVFISYRREDAAPAAGWLFDRLTAHFGPQQVVKDVDLDLPGRNAAEVIAAAVASCDALVVLIGRQWLTAAGPGGVRRLSDPGDSVRLEIEAAVARDIQVIPVLVNGADLPQAGALPPSLAGLAREDELELSPNRAEADVVWLLQVLDQTVAERQARQAGSAGSVGDQRTVTAQPLGWQHQAPAAPGPSAGPPASGDRGPGQSASGDHGTGQHRAGQPRPGRTKTMRRSRLRSRSTVLIAVGAVIAAAIAAFIVLPGSKPAPSAGAQNSAGPKTSSSPSASASVSTSSSSPSPVASSNVILTDDFSTRGTNWLDDVHQTAGAYTGTGTYRLTVTGADGQNELARPSNAADGLGDPTALNLSLSVDARKIAGAAQGYGYGIATRADGSGDFYAFVIEDHAVAIQKWVDNGARVSDSPASVATSALHADAADHLRAVTQTVDGGSAVHLELWLNGKKLIDFTDHDHPYTTGYLGLYVESISDSTSTAEAEFDNFSAAKL